MATNRCKVEFQLNIYARHYGTLRDLRHNTHFAWGSLFALDAVAATLWRPAALRFTARPFIFSTQFSISTPMFVDSIECRIFQFSFLGLFDFWQGATLMTLLWSPCGAGRRLFVFCSTSVFPFYLHWARFIFLLSVRNSINIILTVAFHFYLNKSSPSPFSDIFNVVRDFNTFNYQ